MSPMRCVSKLVLIHHSRMKAALIGDSLVPVQASSVEKFRVLIGVSALKFVNNPLYSDRVVTVGPR